MIFDVFFLSVFFGFKGNLHPELIYILLIWSVLVLRAVNEMQTMCQF